MAVSKEYQITRHDYTKAYYQFEQPQYPYCDPTTDFSKKGEFWAEDGIDPLALLKNL